MLRLISENLSTIIVGTIVFALVAAAVVKLIRDKIKRKSSCGCGCAGCPSAGICGTKPKENK